MRDFNACFEICLNQKNTGKHIFFDNQGNILLDGETNSFISNDMTIKNDAYKVYESKTSAIFISQQNPWHQTCFNQYLKAITNTHY